METIWKKNVKKINEKKIEHFWQEKSDFQILFISCLIFFINHLVCEKQA
jgi:hypothetical protein